MVVFYQSWDTFSSDFFDPQIRMGKKKWLRVQDHLNSSTSQFTTRFVPRIKLLDPVDPFVHLPFNHPGLLYISNIIIMRHQLVTYLQIGIHESLLEFVMGLQEVVELSSNLFFKAIDIFWMEAFRKPPDKSNGVYQTQDVQIPGSNPGRVSTQDGVYQTHVVEKPTTSPLLLEEEKNQPLVHFMNEKKRRLFIAHWTPQTIIYKTLDQCIF